MMSGVFHSIESSRVVGVHDVRSVDVGVGGGVGAAAAHRDDGGDGAAAAQRDVCLFTRCCFGRKNISCLSRVMYRFTRFSCNASWLV